MDAARAGPPRPPRVERIGRIGARCAETVRVEPELVEHLGRPERCDDVAFAPPAPDAGSLGEHASQIRALGVEAAECLLAVRETRPILDVQQGRLRHIPHHHVRAARELVVLIRLVEPDLAAGAPQFSREDLAHRGMHGIFAAARLRPRSRKPEIPSQVQRPAKSDVRLQRSRPAMFDSVDTRCGEARQRRDLPECQAPAFALGAKRGSQRRGVEACLVGCARIGIVQVSLSCERLSGLSLGCVAEGGSMAAVTAARMLFGAYPALA